MAQYTYYDSFDCHVQCEEILPDSELLGLSDEELAYMSSEEFKLEMELEQEAQLQDEQQILQLLEARGWC